MIDDVIKILAVGKTVTTGAASANTTLPLNSAGKVPRCVRVNVSSGSAYIKLGDGSTTCTTNDIMVTAGDSIKLATYNLPNFAHLQFSAATSLNVTPVEE